MSESELFFFSVSVTQTVPPFAMSKLATFGESWYHFERMLLDLSGAFKSMLLSFLPNPKADSSLQSSVNLAYVLWGLQKMDSVRIRKDNSFIFFSG